MPRREFPALGFDPAPGDVRALATSSGEMQSVGRAFGRARADLDSLDSSGWTGAAGDGFRARLENLPGDLDLAAAAHATASKALEAFGAGLADRQRRADQLEGAAEQLQRQHREAISTVNGIRSSRAGNGSAEVSALPGEYQAATSRAEALEEELARVVAEARRLHGEHQSAARSAAQAIRAASDPPYRKPSGLSRALSAVRRWITHHADALAEISTVLTGLSAVLGALSLVPGLQFLAPLAMLAGGLALALDSAVKIAAGRGSWKTIALDAALTAVPAGPVARAIKAVPGVNPAVRAANRAIPAAVKGPVFRAGRNLPQGLDRAQATQAADLIRRRAAHYGDDVVVQGSRAGYSVRPGSDIDIGMRVSPERFEQVIRARYSDVHEGPALDKFVAERMEHGIIHSRRAGLHPVVREIQRTVGCRVDLSVIRRGGPFDTEPWLRLPDGR